MTTLRITRSPLWIPGIALALAVVLFALEVPTAARQVNAALSAVSVLLTCGVAVAVRARYPQRPMSTLLFALAAVLALQPALGSSSNPYLFTLARIARVASELVLVWLMLTFPSGRLGASVDRWLLAGLVAAVLLLWLPANLFMSGRPITGPVLACEGGCPRNVLFVSDRPAVAGALVAVFRAVVVLLLLGVVLRMLQRLLRATPLLRRMLAVVQIVFVLRLLSLMLFLAVGWFGWLPILLNWMVPVAMGLGLLRGRLWIARALQQLVAGLRATPTRIELQALIARALDDPSLQVGYWLPESSRWIDAAGHELVMPSAGDSRRATRMIAGEHGEAAAVLVHDAALLEEPALVEAVAHSMRMVLAGHQLEAALQATRTDAAQAVASERERIERNLHDGAQQRLLALRMKLGVVQRLIDVDPARAASLVGEAGPEIDAALAELRELAHGIVPGLLLEEGLPTALAQLVRGSPCPALLQLEPVGRFDGAIEQAVYFCCAEALQNAAKHAGRGARVTLRLWRQDSALHFSVADDGRGLDGPSADTGRGLHNMRKRLEEVGGCLVVSNSAGAGASVDGTVPIERQ